MESDTYLGYARQRLSSFIASTEELAESEFAYGHSRMALNAISQRFVEKLDRLNSFDEQTAPEVVRNDCVVAVSDLFRMLPMLGFVLRSTNVRNSFEAFRPLLRLAGDILEPQRPLKDRKTRLLLSSEWDYSPFTYHSVSGLRNFVMIGLPAPESSNPLVLPLAGHELGHCVWTESEYEKQSIQPVNRAVMDVIAERWDEYSRQFPGVVQGDLREKTKGFGTLLDPVNWCLRQAKETFCDYLGLKIFGEAFLFAFAYLLTPGVGRRTLDYPSLDVRARNLAEAADSFDVPVPPGYAEQFQPEETKSLIESDRLHLSIADDALARLRPMLQRFALEAFDESALSGIDRAQVDRIYECFKRVVPAERTQSIVEILNAAWVAHNDPSLWEGLGKVRENRARILRELVLKNLEIHEIETIMREEL